MRSLLRHAADLGLTVHAARLDDEILGEWYQEEREVYFDLRLTPAEQRSVVAHELGHAFYGHTCDSQRNEDQADIYAARILIDPRRYADLGRVNPDRHHLADEFCVTVDVISTFEKHCLTRMRGVTYAFARMGARQAAFAAPHTAY